jgi:PAS domain S-box-containing protein
MSQSRPGTKVAAVVLLASVVPWLLSFTSHLVIGDAELVQEPLHEGFELAGSCIALGVAMLLLLRLRREIAPPHLRCVVAALVGMGIIDGVDSLVRFDVTLSWSRHAAALVGGTVFALVWLRQAPAAARRCRLIVPAVATLALAIAVAIWLWSERLPPPWADGVYSGLAIASNVLGGLGFMAAAAFFVRRYLRAPKAEDLVFASLALLFGTASVFYGVSHAWAADWWVWHGARLFGYAIVLVAAYDVVVALYEEQGRLTQELESRVQRRTAALVSANIELQRNQSLLAETERLGKVGGWTFDIGTGQQTWTETVYDIHEVDSTFLPTVENGVAFYTPASRSIIAQAVQRAIDHGDPFDVDLEIVTAKGHLRSVHAIGRADPARRKVSGFFQDITERKRAEQALLMKNLVFDASVAANSIADVGGVITEVNPAFLRIWGVSSKDEAVGKPISAFLQNEDEAVEIVTALQTVGDWAGDYTAKRADGTLFLANGLATTLRNGEGEIVGYQSSVLDVTDQRRADGEVRRLNEHLEKRVLERTAQLEASNKELEAFSYSVSHDLRAPLRAIDGFGRILVEDYNDRLDPEGRRVLAVISSETRRMGQLIDDLLEFSRIGRQKMESATIDIAEMARAVFADQSAQVPDRDVRLELQPLPAAGGDRAMIRVVLGNLISNAIKFTAPRHPAVIEIGGRWEDGQTVYWVKDNGVGFEMRYAHKLFGVFQRLHSREEFDGTGVGLALAQRVIHRHGGRIWADGIVDGGAVFSFSLPDRKGE